ncbi:MAG TPA: hypothetical protein VD790_07870 [Thermoleophilaceae bacterium]|nr:hypothetical protein [Thermoleophilaceae bacterium]
MADIGPVQMLVVAFDSDAKFEGKVIEQLSALESESTIRILDLLFAMKDENGELVALDYQSESLGAIAGALLGFEFEGDETPGETTGTTDHAFGLTQADIEEVGNSLEPKQAAAFLLIEHVWARDLKRAIRETGGVPVAEGFLTPEAVRAVEPELAAMADAMQELEREQAASVGA